MSWNINNKKCMNCGGCVSVCPLGALELKEHIIIDENLCNLCSICEIVCPVSAIKVEK